MRQCADSLRQVRFEHDSEVVERGCARKGESVVGADDLIDLCEQTVVDPRQRLPNTHLAGKPLQNPAMAFH